MGYHVTVYNHTPGPCRVIPGVGRYSFFQNVTPERFRNPLISIACFILYPLFNDHLCVILYVLYREYHKLTDLYLICISNLKNIVFDCQNHDYRMQI